MNSLRKLTENVYLIMDRAYSDKNIREVARKKGIVEVVPPKSNMSGAMEYDKERNVVARLFSRLKIFRMIAKGMRS